MAKSSKQNVGVLPFEQEFPTNDDSTFSSESTKSTVGRRSEKEPKDTMDEDTMALEGESRVKELSPEEADAFEDALEEESILSSTAKEARDKPITIKDTEELFDDREAGEERRLKSRERDIIGRLVERGKLLPLDIDKDIDEYDDDEIEELLIANMEERTEKAQETVLEQFIAELDDNARKILEYAISGGKDFKSILKAIGELQEVNELEDHPEQVVRTYLKYKGMEDDEIEEQLDIYKKANALSSIADKYRDKVVELKQKEVERTIEEQKKYEEQRRKYAEWYVQQVDNTLKKGKIGDIPVDRNKARLLKKIVTEPTHTSLSGEKVPEFVKLLERYSVEDPNPERIVEAAWLLYDREGFIDALTQKIKSEVKAEEIRKLRSTMQKDKSGGSMEEPDVPLKKQNTARTSYKWKL